MKLRRLPADMERRISPRAYDLHALREECVRQLPKFLNPAHGTRSGDVTHTATHLYFDRLVNEPRFAVQEARTLPDATANLVKSFTGARHVVFGSSVSWLFGHLLSSLAPSMLLGTRHEYPGLVECARTGRLDSENLTTWPMYGWDSKDVPMPALPAGVPTQLISPDFTPPGVTPPDFTADYPISKLVTLAVQSPGSSTVLMSHVSRVDGRILPVAAVDREIQAINRHRHPENKIHFVVDGSQAVGSMEIDLSSFGGIYLFTSSKALGAEPCVGVGLANEDYAALLTSLLSRLPGAGSLPELRSLHDILASTDFSKTYPELIRMKQEAYQLLGAIPGLQLAPSVFDPAAHSPYLVYFSIPGQNPSLITRAAAQEGFSIDTDSSRYTYTQPFQCRISFISSISSTCWEHIEEFSRFLADFIPTCLRKHQA